MSLRAAAVVAALGAAGCSDRGAPAPDDLARYLDDADFRRAEMAASLVSPTDGYARLRLERYGLAWEALPVWNPRVSPVTTADPVSYTHLTLPTNREV